MDVDLPKPYFDRKLYYDDFLKKLLDSRKETDKVPGYNYTFLEFKKLLFESSLEYTKDGGLRFSALGSYLSLDQVKRYMMHGDWDDPNYTKNERKLAYKIYLLEKKLCDCACGSKNTS